MRKGAVRGACGFGLGGLVGGLLTDLVFSLDRPEMPYRLIVGLVGLMISHAVAGAIGARSLRMGRRATIGFGVGFGVVLSFALPLVVLTLIGLQAVGSTPGPGLHYFIVIAVSGAGFGIAGVMGAALARESRLIWVGFWSFVVGGVLGGLVIVAYLALIFGGVLSPPTSPTSLLGASLLGLTAPYVIGGAVFGSAVERIRSQKLDRLVAR